MVSNGLLFTFLENKETQRFIAPALKLPGRHAISNRIFSKSAKNLTQSIVKQAKADVIGVTAAFDGWTNVKREHLFGVVFITSSGKTKTLVINSLKLMMLKRQLRIEYPSKTLITKCLPECIGTPSTSRTGISRQHYKTNTNNENKCLPSDNIEIINDPMFWTQLFELQNLLLPICGALNKLQSDVSCLYEITHCFGWIINMFSSHKDEKFGNCMTGRLESRWAHDTEELEETSIIDDCNVNDIFEEYDNNNTLNPEQWTKIIESWIELVNTENYSNNLDSREVEPYDFEVGGHDTHPADNPSAKWKLFDLFNDSLEAPIYMVQ
ncbi:hypothetical protein RhiirC2_816375 [Rhizophagus irregularis]|uniref:DUF659 domain-containing protein n=1 Tax=Rhizophagus irregularis TaxID=588596 RepID=A0A2N1NPS6_9GLOM|nr:hypothetical protein RhiirC2_816375 [Rhizophagus irregularis]